MTVCSRIHMPMDVCTVCLNVGGMSLWLSVMSIISDSLSLVRRVFISNLQKEIEKQTGYRSSRRRRSESQYDYEVYHSLDEVDVKPTVCPYLPLAPLLPSHLMHRPKQINSSTALSNSPSVHSSGLCPTALCCHTQARTPRFRRFTASECLFCPGRLRSQLMNLSGPVKRQKFHTEIRRADTYI